MENKTKEPVEEPEIDVNIAKDINKIHEYFDLINMLIGEGKDKDPGLDALLSKGTGSHS